MIIYALKWIIVLIVKRFEVENRIGII